MKYEFNLEDYWDIMEEIEERDDVRTYGFRQIKVTESEESELWALGYRIFIPELNRSFRNGFDYYKSEDGEEDPEDSIIEYIGDEKDPEKFDGAYSNSFFTSLVAMIAKELGKNTNPKCYIDDEEFDIWTDDD